MPPFAEKESSILAVLKKKSGRMSAQEAQKEARTGGVGGAAAEVAAGAVEGEKPPTGVDKSSAKVCGLEYLYCLKGYMKVRLWHKRLKSVDWPSI